MKEHNAVFAKLNDRSPRHVNDLSIRLLDLHKPRRVAFERNGKEQGGRNKSDVAVKNQATIGL